MPLYQKICIAIVFVFFAVVGGPAHFWDSDFFVKIMPPYLPYHLEIVYISGFFEILGGLGLLYAPTRHYAGYGLLVLTVAVFPANIHMAMHPELFTEFFPPDLQEHAAFLLRFVRLPLQLVILALIWFASQPKHAKH